MNQESESSPFDAARAETEAEIERLNKEIEAIDSKEEKAKRVQSIKTELESAGLDTSIMDQHTLVSKFVSREAEKMLKGE